MNVSTSTVAAPHQVVNTLFGPVSHGPSTARWRRIATSPLRQGLGSTAITVFLAISPQCETLDELAEKTDLCHNTARRALVKLTQAGAVIATESKGRIARRYSTPHFDHWTKLPLAVEQILAQEEKGDELIAVYLAIRCHAGTGECRPSIRTLAALLHLQKSTVTTDILALERLGVLTVIRCRNVVSKKKWQEYKFPAPNPSLNPATSGTEVDLELAESKANTTPTTTQDLGGTPRQPDLEFDGPLEAQLPDTPSGLRVRHFRWMGGTKSSASGQCLTNSAGADERGLMRIDQLTKAVDARADAFLEMLSGSGRSRAGRTIGKAGFETGKAYGRAIGINSTKRLRP
jgi:DNA-binding transcriptional regulator YhcF (GntR family)